MINTHAYTNSKRKRHDQRSLERYATATRPQIKKDIPRTSSNAESSLSQRD
jgi:hypothetical protein